MRIINYVDMEFKFIYIFIEIIYVFYINMK